MLGRPPTAPRLPGACRRRLRPQQRQPLPLRQPALGAAQLAALVAREALQATVIAQMAHGLCMFDAGDRLLMANQRFREIWQLPQALCQPGTPFQTIIAASHGARLVDDALLPAADDPQTIRRRREWLLDDQRIIEVHTTRLASGVVVALHADITAQRLAQQQVEHLAHHDALTGLPNRRTLHGEIQRALPRTGRGEALAVLCLDLDRFKPVNDMLGHDAGDALLRQVAQRLRQNLRESDSVARLGGDEFAILQTGAEQPAGATGLARRVIAALAEPFDLDGHQVHIGTSVGVAIAPADGDSPDALLKSADLALYLAKDAGRGVLRLFEPGLDARMLLRRQLEADLRGALGRGEFSLAYQAQVALPGKAGAPPAQRPLPSAAGPASSGMAPSELAPSSPTLE
jgi:diguanylate cyclase (GGDEF)-like protein